MEAAEKRFHYRAADGTTSVLSITAHPLSMRISVGSPRSGEKGKSSPFGRTNFGVGGAVFVKCRARKKSRGLGELSHSGEI